MCRRTLQPRRVLMGLQILPISPRVRGLVRSRTGKKEGHVMTFGVTALKAIPLDLKHDFPASIVVFLVALPLCIGIAIASGAPPGAGLISGIIGGLVVGTLAGSPLQVSGPAAGLVVIVWDLVQVHGMAKLGIIVLLAGAFQIVAALLQLGQWFRAVCPAVVQGMLAGIGILIVASQFHVMVDDVPKDNGISNILSIPEAVWKGLVPLDGSSHHTAARIGLLTIIAIVLWKALTPKKFQVIPAPLVGVVIATAEAALQQLPISYVKVYDNIFTLIQLPGFENLAHLSDPSIVAEALALAFIASTETLLCATALDHLHRGPRTHYNREMMAQGVGNMLCGLLGALPVTGVIVRSSANVVAGARTRVSAILHGAWLLLFVAYLPFLLRLIPTASLAAVLVFTGYKLMNLEAIRELKKYGRGEIMIYAMTLGMIVTTNLLTGVLVGLGVAIAKLVYTTQYLETHFSQDRDTGTASLQLSGIATFVSLPKLATALEQVAPGAHVHIHFEPLRHIDHACLNLLSSWKNLHELNEGRVTIDWAQLQTLLHQGRNARRGTSTQPPERGARPDMGDVGRGTPSEPLS